ncbi:MAG: hypothetical protein JW923_00775 [Spirochaetales bacterium]|nr:hypothetical protein [Spirochaetales bacterium]
MGFNAVTRVDDLVRIRSVIVSVYDKTGLEGFLVRVLGTCPGVRFYATGGTYQFISGLLGERSGAHLVKMSDYTRQPEMKGGLVKTLDWRIYLGLLAEPYDEDHGADLRRHDAVAFDMVVGNLYAFGQAAETATGFEEARQHIDIGGPCMIRAAAKNFLRVAAVPGPDLYDQVADALERGKGALRLEDRARLAGEVFRRQAQYDAAVADFFVGKGASLLPSSYR